MRADSESTVIFAGGVALITGAVAAVRPDPQARRLILTRTVFESRALLWYPNTRIG